MTSYSALLGKMAIEIGSSSKSPALLIFRGALMEVDIINRDVIPRRFIRFLGTSSTFLMVRSDEGLKVCNVAVIQEPLIYRNKLKNKGLFKLVSCSTKLIPDTIA